MSTLAPEATGQSTDDLGDANDHFACYVCYRGTPPGVVITALCGKRIVEDDNHLITNKARACLLCNIVDVCPECGLEFCETVY